MDFTIGLVLGFFALHPLVWIVLLFTLAAFMFFENYTNSYDAYSEPSGEPAVVALISSIVLFGLEWFTETIIISWAFQNFGSFLLGAIIFLGVGLLWASYKWWDRINSDRMEELFLDSPSTYKRLISFNNNKGRYFNWVIAWPISILLYVFGEMFAKLYRAIIKMMGTMMQNLSDRRTADLEKKYPSDSGIAE